MQSVLRLLHNVVIDLSVPGCLFGPLGTIMTCILFLCAQVLRLPAGVTVEHVKSLVAERR